MNVKPLGARLLVRKCERDHVRDADGKILVALSDGSLSLTRWVEILAVGAKCKMFRKEQIGGLAQTVADKPVSRVPGTKADYIVPEYLMIGAVFYDD